MDAAITAKNEAVEQGYLSADQEWKELMFKLVVDVAFHKSTFTSDDVFDALDSIPNAPTTHDNRAFGGVMLRAARAGYCRKANVAAIPSRRKELHASPRAVWESRVTVA